MRTVQEFFSQPIRLRRGCLIVTRIDQETHYSKEFDWIKPDEWRKEFTTKCECHLHEPDAYPENLTGKIIYIDKYAGLDLGFGLTTVLINEGAVLAYEDE